MDNKSILAAIKSATGIEQLNPMQAAVMAAHAQRLILLSPTGSGKTLAFAIALLQRMDPTRAGSGTRAVVVTPSRELTQQVYGVLRAVATGFKTLALYGGNPMEAEKRSIQAAPPDIIVATPGRLVDHLQRKTLDLTQARLLVVDEYDKALELGFQEQMQRIARVLARRSFTMLTSATQLDTLPDFIEGHDVETIDFTDHAPAGHTEVISVPSATADKLDTLGALLRSVDSTLPTMVFVNHRESAARVASWLRKHGVAAVLYHGALEQRQREMAVAALASGAAPVMVATDLAGRGLDIPQVGAVVHYHLPADEKTYTHRNGRTARAGASGQVYVITGPEEYAPEFIVTQREFYPDTTAQGVVDTPTVLLYIAAGKRDKISRGDIAGFIAKSAGVDPSLIGKIFVGQDYSLVAVASRQGAQQVLQASRTSKLKGHKTRITEHTV